MYPADTISLRPETIFFANKQKIIIITSLIQVTSPAKVIRAKPADNNEKKVSQIGPHPKMGQIINRRRSLPIPIRLIRTSSPERRGGGGGKRDLDLRYLAVSTFFFSPLSSRFFVKAVRSVWDLVWLLG